ncbi:hypothetical protein HanHA300_Chr14g0546841 [Helianthus annuus]|nr:hypothetical protein HanHA300_Chr14g0546841 [Helianthus annuus]KAJ0658257.1 hypothetical protein HanLR1_Chr14g0555731 [Helianthus annuus]
MCLTIFSLMLIICLRLGNAYNLFETWKQSSKIEDYVVEIEYNKLYIACIMLPSA